MAFDLTEVCTKNVWYLQNFLNSTIILKNGVKTYLGIINNSVFVIYCFCGIWKQTVLCSGFIIVCLYIVRHGYK